MKVLSAEFVLSAAQADQLPQDLLPQVALVGRSNVGKSSVINALTRSRLARTSAEPGKTRLLNAYRISLSGGVRLYLVDLPGFGFARGPAQDFDALLAGYWEARRHAAGPTLCVFMVDARHPGLDADLATWAWLDREGFDRIVVLTKVDKLSRAERTRHFRQFDTLFNVPRVAVSALRGEGLDDLWHLILKHLHR